MPKRITHQSCPGVRLRLDSQPSIHLPREVNLPGTKMGGCGFSRLDRGAKKSSLASRVRPLTRADARSASRANAGVSSSPIGLGPVCSAEFCMLTQSSYGKERIRLVQVLRRPDRDDVRDLTVAVRFDGDYDASYTDGDNTDVLPTDTMRNTVYALAAQEAVRDIESFGLRLARHFLERNRCLTRVTIDLAEHHWNRIAHGGREHGHAFLRHGAETRTAAVSADRDASTVSAGAADL